MMGSPPWPSKKSQFSPDSLIWVSECTTQVEQLFTSQGSSFLSILPRSGWANALQERIIISTKKKHMMLSAVVVCQCPTRANHHFYQLQGRIWKGNSYDVSMPYTGEPSFLRYPFKNGLFTPFLRVFMQVFFRIFWKQTNLLSFWCCSQFVHISLKMPNFNNPAFVANPGHPSFYRLYFCSETALKATPVCQLPKPLTRAP